MKALKPKEAKQFDFLKFSPICYTISVVLVLASLISIFFINGFQFGTDFTGGIEVMIAVDESIGKSQIQNDLDDKKFNVEVEKVVSEKNRYIIRMAVRENEDELEREDSLTTLLKQNYAKKNLVVEQTRIVGGVVSSENKDNAIKIIISAVIFIILYISFRFRWEYGLGAIIAVIHDVIFVLGLMSFTGMEVGILTITAILTIFGYSVNDTIILYDRIRETLKKSSSHNKTNRLINKEIVNTSINAIIVRTFFTSFTTIVVVGALYFNSQASLQDFSAALIIGLIVGTYSSIYVACGFLFFWQRFIIRRT